VFHWLLLLKQFHPLFAEINITPFTEEQQVELNGIPNQLIRNAIYQTIQEESENIAELNRADIANPDIQQERHGFEPTFAQREGFLPNHNILLGFQEIFNNPNDDDASIDLAVFDEEEFQDHNDPNEIDAMQADIDNSMLSDSFPISHTVLSQDNVTNDVNFNNIENPTVITQQRLQTRVQVDIPVVIEEVLNEYTQNKNIIRGGFPCQFIMGEGIRSNGTQTEKQCVQWMSLFDTRFQRRHSLIFLLHNQKQRHSLAADIATKVRGGHPAVTAFQRLVADGHLEERVRMANRDPDHADSRALVRLLTSIVHITGKNVEWSTLKRKSTLRQMYALGNHFDVFTYFVTISLSDTHSALLLRLATDQGDYGVVRSIEIPLLQNTSEFPTTRQRNKIVASNPAAQAKLYSSLIYAVLSYLIGLSPVHLRKKNPPSLYERPVGVLGKCLSYISVTESQERLSPHTHAQIVTNLSASIVRRNIDNPERMATLMRQIDSIVTCEWDRQADIEQLPTLIQLSTLICPPCNSAEFRHRKTTVARRCNEHPPNHNLSCHKGPSGRNHCRFIFQKHCFNCLTAYRQLDYTENVVIGRNGREINEYLIRAYER
jgi:hypothetical protein